MPVCFVLVYHTLNTCRQFLPLSFNRLSSISIISTKSVLSCQEIRKPERQNLRCSNALIVRQLRKLVHLSSARPPWIVAGGQLMMGRIHTWRTLLAIGQFIRFSCFHVTDSLTIHYVCYLFSALIWVWQP